MAIKKIINKKAFTLIELMVSIMLFSFVVLGSIKAYSYLSYQSKMNEMRYLLLNRIDSEMSRLVFAYENLPKNDFTDGTNSDNSDWDNNFSVPYNAPNKVDLLGYSSNPLSSSEPNFGLTIAVSTSGDLNNIINIYDAIASKSDLSNDSIVGLMAWKVDYNSTRANLSLSITYPYKVVNYISADGGMDTVDIVPLHSNILETINIKTTTKVKQ